MKKYFFLALFSLLLSISYSQTTYISVTGGGNWNDAATWDVDFDNTGGDGIPVAGDVAIIIGDGVGGGIVNITSNVSVGDLYVVTDIPNVLSKGGSLFATYTLTITGQLGGVLNDLSDFGPPTTTVIENDQRLNIVFTGVGNSPNISGWGTVSALRNVTTSGTVTFEDVTIFNNSSLDVSSGSLTINNGFAVEAGGSGSSISVLGNLNVNGAINGGTAATNFGTVTNDGTINIGISGYLNTNTFNINANSTLNVSNNQPNGWWHATSPGLLSSPIDVTSTINYNRIGTQGIFAGTYGNLNMTGGSGTKSLSAGGSLIVLSNLNIGGSSTFDTSGNPNVIDISGNIDNDGIWAPTQLVNLKGGTAQNIGGNTDITFIGGLNISGASTVVQIVSPQNIVISGILDVDPSASFNPNGRQVNLAGNLVVDGTIIASGTFVFDGTTAVSGVGTKAFNNVIVSNTLTAPSQIATIAGNFTNNGTFTNVNGTVTFNGTNAQSISGSSTNEFYNLSITNTGATVSNNATTNLNTAMTMAANTTFDADGSGASVFTIKSTSGTNTARINALPTGASITGNVVAQRYFNLITGAVGTGVWRNFGVSVNGATVTQITSAGFTINGNDLAREDETLGGPVNDRFELQSSFGSSIANNEGYTMFTRNADVPAVISFTGTLNQGTQSMPITYTSSGTPSDDGWNLVNNPFPSTIDWDNMNRAGAISGIVSVWNTDTDTYDTWNGTTGGLSNGLIASGQAFWIQTTGGGASLNIPESAKVTSSTTFLRSSAEDEITNQIIVALSQDEKIDRTYIHFREDAVDEFNSQLDGRKLTNGIFNIASLSSDDVILAINSLSSITNCTKEVKLQFDEALWDNVKNENFRGFTPGTYELNFSGLNSFTQALDFVLIDNYNGNIVSTPITENLVYSFVVDTTKVNSWGANRFLIQLSEKTIVADVVHSVTQKCELGAEVTFSNTQAGLLYSIEKNGELIVEKIADGSDLTMIIPIGKTVVGSNSFDLNLINGSCSNLVLQNEIIFESSQLLEISSVTDGESCGSGQILLNAEGATGTAYYNWYETIDAIDPIIGENSSEFLTPVLEASKFYYVAVLNEAGCESSERVKVTAIIKSPPSADFLYQEANICDLSSNLVITNAEIGATYNLMKNSQLLVAVLATETDLTLPLTLQQVSEGVNTFDMIIEKEGCSTEVLNAIEITYASTQEIASVQNGKTCETGQVILVASGASGNAHYNWYETIDAVDPIPAATGNEYLTPVIDASKSYYVSIVNENGCESAKVEVIAEIVSIEQPEVQQDDKQGVLTTSAVADSYAWYKEGVLLEGEAGNSLLLIETGNYEVEIISNGCASRSDVYSVDRVLGLKELEQLGISIYPNPVADILKITNSSAVINSIIIYDTKGVAVYRSSKVIPNEINLSSIKKGIYIINIATDSKTINYRVRKK